MKRTHSQNTNSEVTKFPSYPCLLNRLSNNYFKYIQKGKSMEPRNLVTSGKGGLPDYDRSPKSRRGMYGCKVVYGLRASLLSRPFISWYGMCRGNYASIHYPLLGLLIDLSIRGAR